MRDRRQSLLGMLGPALLACALMLAPPTACSTTDGERGQPLLRNFAPKEYAAHAQNWGIVQDPRGVIYSANSDGVLEYDGLRWRLIRTSNRSVVRSLAVADDGRVYVGAFGEIGYLAPDATGLMQYVSLLDQVPQAARAFDDVHHVFVTPRGVYFASYARLIRLHAGQATVWEPQSAFHRAFLAAGRIYIRERERGLQVLGDDDRLTLVADGGRFADERVDAVVAWPELGADALLVGTRTQGLFVLADGALRSFHSAIDAELARDALYSALRLRDGSLALGTIQGGVYFIDRNGALLGHLDKNSGLKDNTIYALALDREHGLWLGQDRGLARVAAAAPLGLFDERQGLDGSVLSLQRHRGVLHVGTAQGLFRLRAGARPRFEPVAGITGQTYALLAQGDDLLVANNEGTYLLDDRGARLIQRGETATAMALLASRATPGRVYVGLWDGLASLRREDGRWIDEGRIAGIGEDISSLAEDADGRLWTGSSASGVLRIRFDALRLDAAPVVAAIERFAAGDGLPGGNDNFVQTIGGVIVHATHAGIFRFREDSRRFEPDPRFAALFPDGPRWIIYGTAEDPAQRVWMQSKDERSGHSEAGMASAGADGHWQWDASALRAFADAWIEKIYADADGVVWFGGADGLYRFDPALAQRERAPFQALLRQVAAPSGGRVHFAGGGTAPALMLAYVDNALRFDFAAPSFGNVDATRYQAWLDGNDATWSPWMAEGFREYTNLRPGDYRFRVRALNLEGIVSEVAEYRFRVLPPWYRTPWAYLAYALVAALAIWALLRWRVRRIEAEKHALEGTIAARTRELQGKNEQLEQARVQAEAQRNAAEELRAHAEQANRSKSVFLANMSHELRTPLNGVLGFAQLMDRAADRSPEDRRHLATILRSGEHLLGLINDVLSLSKIEAGGLALNTAPFDPQAVLVGVCDLMRVRAEARDLWLRIETHDLPPIVLGDAQKLSQIVLNLVGNAVKFTERGGVTLRARWAEGRACIEIEDSGVGIAAEEIEQLFAPFVQSAAGREAKEGTGLGLALSRQLARLMGGDIGLRSTPGQGTTLRVELALPAVAAADTLLSTREQRRVRRLAPGQSAIRVLVADDVADNRALLSGLLRAVGFEVREADDGLAAIAIWREWQPQLIWMDKRMPGMDGTTAARRIRDEEAATSRARVAILALSASAFEHERAEILASGCDDFVPKPFRESLIFAKMAQFTAAVFEYDDPTAASAAAAVAPAERIAQMPQAWREAMRRALALGDTRLAAQLAGEIEETDAALCALIRNLLGAYRLDELEQMFGADAVQ